MSRMKNYPCACAFAKVVDDKNPYHFPRVGMSTDVLYRCRPIVEHYLTGTRATILRSKEAAECCFDWFDQSLPQPERKGDSCDEGSK